MTSLPSTPRCGMRTLGNNSRETWHHSYMTVQGFMERPCAHLKLQAQWRHVAHTATSPLDTPKNDAVKDHCGLYPRSQSAIGVQHRTGVQPTMRLTRHIVQVRHDEYPGRGAAGGHGWQPSARPPVSGERGGHPRRPARDAATRPHPHSVPSLVARYVWPGSPFHDVCPHSLG